MTLRQTSYICPMTKRTKQLLSFLLLALFSFNVIGYYFAFLVLDDANRTEMQTLVSQKTITETLLIQRSEIQNVVFEEKGKEMQYNGEMYDIKDFSAEGDHFIFHCIHDTKETQLVGGLNAHTNYNSTTAPSSGKKQNDSSKNPVKDLFFVSNDLPEKISVHFEFPSAICHFTSYISSPLPLPPPEVSIA